MSKSEALQKMVKKYKSFSINHPQNIAQKIHVQTKLTIHFVPNPNWMEKQQTDMYLFLRREKFLRPPVLAL